jgi:CTP synthase
MKGVVILGGGSSEIGKSVITASISYLLKRYGIEVFPIKFDGYININTGNMCKYHTTQKFKVLNEEVFVLKDGTETDSDLGVYERFVGVELDRNSYITNGQLLYNMITKDKGDGRILTLNTLKEEYKKILTKNSNKVLIIEVGGTVGDPENSLFLETLSELSHDNQILFILVAPILYIHKPRKDVLSTSYSKLIRFSVNLLSRKGIKPDAIICRTREELPFFTKQHIIRETGIKNLKELPFVDNIYEIPSIIQKTGLINLIIRRIGLKKRKGNKQDFLKNYVKKSFNYKKRVNILVTDRMESYDSYVSLIEGLNHAGVANNCKVEISWLNGSLINLKQFNGIVVLNDFEKVREKKKILKIARKIKIPVLGISGGMYLIVKEYVTNVLKKDIKIKHGKLKVGEYKTNLSRNSRLAKIYGTLTIFERHRHSEIIEDYRSLQKSNLMPVGFSERKELDAVELKNHKFYIGVSFHPEFLSKPFKPHPLLTEFIRSLF